MTNRGGMAVVFTLAFVGACATYTVVGADGGADGSSSDSSTAEASTPLGDAATTDASVPVDAAREASASCTACGTDCCYEGTAKDHCGFGNVCGKCAAVGVYCRGNEDCCDAGKCATDNKGDAGLCRATCKGKFGLCGSTNECCLGLRCEPNGNLTLCQ